MDSTNTDGMTKTAFPLLQHFHVLKEENDVGVVPPQFREDAHELPKEVALTFELKALLLQLKVAAEGVDFLALGGTHALHLAAKAEALAVMHNDVVAV